MKVKRRVFIIYKLNFKMLNRFRYKYKIEHDHFIPSIGRVTQKKVELLTNKSGRYR
jgi:hypothetical protein